MHPLGDLTQCEGLGGRRMWFAVDKFLIAGGPKGRKGRGRGQLTSYTVEKKTSHTGGGGRPDPTATLPPEADSDTGQISGGGVGVM